MLRGEIWWASMSAPVASEPGYRRPVLVVQADSFNRSTIATVICAVITSNTRLARAPGNILIEKDESILSKTSVINVSQIVTLDKSFLTERVGSVSARVLRDVEAGMRLVLDME